MVKWISGFGNIDHMYLELYNDCFIIYHSYNTLELLHKVDQSKNGNYVNAFDAPAQAATDISVALPLFNLLTREVLGCNWPHHLKHNRHPSIHHCLVSSLNDIYSGQLDTEGKLGYILILHLQFNLFLPLMKHLKGKIGIKYPAHLD